MPKISNLSLVGLLISLSLVNTSEAKNANEYSIVIDYSKTLEEMIKDSKFDVVDELLASKRFPSKAHGRQEVKFEIVNLSKKAKTAEVLRSLLENGLRPATLQEFVAFEQSFRPDQEKYNIVALGTSVINHKSKELVVPMVFGRPGWRLLILGRQPVKGWAENTLYLAVRE